MLSHIISHLQRFVIYWTEPLITPSTVIPPSLHPSLCFPCPSQGLKETVPEQQHTHFLSLAGADRVAQLKANSGTLNLAGLDTHSLLHMGGVLRGPGNKYHCDFKQISYYCCEDSVSKHEWQCQGLLTP